MEKQFPHQEQIDTHDPEIMSYKEYSERKWQTPYIFELENKNTKLLYFGTKHCFDPEDPIIDEIKSNFKELRPDYVFIEGNSFLNQGKEERYKEFKRIGEEQLVKERGEPALIIKMAGDAGIDYECPEPDFAKEISLVLEKGFNKEDVFAYYLYRVVYQYHLIPDPTLSIENYLEPFIKRFENSTNWVDFDYSLEHLKEIGEKIWGEKSNINQSAFRIDPIPWEVKKEDWTVVNDVCQASGDIRESYILERILAATKTKKRIFIVYGSTHAVRQEPALRRAFSAN